MRVPLGETTAEPTHLQRCCPTGDVGVTYRARGRWNPLPPRAAELGTGSRLLGGRPQHGWGPFNRAAKLGGRGGTGISGHTAPSILKNAEQRKSKTHFFFLSYFFLVFKVTKRERNTPLQTAERRFVLSVVKSVIEVTALMASHIRGPPGISGAGALEPVLGARWDPSSG